MLLLEDDRGASCAPEPWVDRMPAVTVVRVHDTEAALNRLRNGGVDGLVIDDRIPNYRAVLTGVIDAFPDLPVGVFTGEEEMGERAIDAGAEWALPRADLNPGCLVRAVRQSVRRRRSDRYARAFRSSPEAIAITRLAGHTIVDVNPAFEALFGYEREAVVGKTAPDLGMWVDPDERDRILDRFAREGSVHGVLARFRRKDGTTGVAELSIDPFDLDGEAGALIYSRDVTARVRSEADARRRRKAALRFQERLKALHVVTRELSDVDDPNTLYRLAVERGRGALGFDRMGLLLFDGERITGTFGTDADGHVIDERGIIFDPGVDPQPRVLAMIRKGERLAVWEDESLFDHDKRVATGWHAVAVIHYGGDVLGWLSVDNLLQNRPYTAEQGELLALYAGLLGQRIQVLRSRQEQERLHARLMAFVEHTPAAIFMKDPEGRYLQVNRRFEELSGLHREDVIGRTDRDLFSEEEARRIADEDHIVLEGGRPCQGEWTLTRGKQPRTLLINRFVFSETGEGPATLCGVGVDITARKRAEEALLQSQNDLEERVRVRTEDLSRANDRLRQEAEIRRLTERALRESEERFRAAFDHAPVGMVLSGLDGRTMKVNPAACTLLGAAPDDLIDRVLPYHPVDRERVVAARKSLVAGSTDAVRLELRIRHKNGREVWAMTGLTLVRDELLEPRYFITQLIDITARKTAEARIRMHSRVLEGMAEGVVVTDEEGRILYGNPAVETLFGQTTETLTGQPLSVLIDTAEEAETLAAIEAALEAGGTWTGELAHCRQDGSPFVTSAQVSLLEDEGHRRRVFVLQDVSERKHLLDLLRETQAMASVGGWEIYLINNRLTWTDEVYRIHELPVGVEVDVERAIEYYHPEDRPVIREAVERGMATGAGWDLELRLITARGRQIWVRAIGKAHFREGAPYRVSGTFQDITRLKEAARLKDEFISVVSHELRTPLTSINGSLGLLTGGVAGSLPTTARSMLEVAHRNSRRLVHLINDLLDVQKIEAGQLTINPQPCSLNDLLHQALEANQMYGTRLGVRFELKNGTPDVSLRVDPERFQQVMANLLSNAAKFSPEGRVVDVGAARPAPDQVRVYVRDRGKGIPEAFRDRIFQPFAQADSSNTRRKGGTGLGLNITRSIIQLHGGRIDFESVPGEGTTFFFDLPCDSPRPSGDSKPEYATP